MQSNALGHAVTTDFTSFEHLPIALYPDKDYNSFGCWSGTAIVKDDILYLLYASVNKTDTDERRIATVSVAYSTDGINFEKYEGNPVIKNYPKEGGPDFRDPAVMEKDGKYYIVMATGNPTDKAARLLIYESDDLLNWQYNGVMAEWENSVFAECPSFMRCGKKFLLSASVCKKGSHYFSLMYGDFDGKKFTPLISGSVDNGPDQYAGQIFRDHKGRCILISWIPGWHWQGKLGQDIGCLSVPKEVIIKDGKIYCYPVKEVQHLLKDSDPAVKITDSGFIIERAIGEPVVYKGEINDIKIIRDEYIIEVFVNCGEQIYTAVVF